MDITVKDLATNDLQKLAADFEAPQIREAIGLAGVEAVKEFYTKLDHERPNAMGGKRTHFFAQAAESALWKDTGNESVLLEVFEPIGLRQRIHGGEILPTGGRKYLTIPAIAEAYGKRAGEFDNLVPVFRRRNGTVEAVALAEADQQSVKLGKTRKDGTVSRGKVTGGRYFFWLVKSVSQQGDPTTAPDENSIKTAVIGAVTNYFRALQGSVT